MSLKALLSPPTYWAQIASLPILVACAVYVPLVKWGQRQMATRKPLCLKTPVIVWNFSLSFLSFVALVTIAANDPSCLVRRKYPVADMSGPTMLAILAFCLTKVLEFGDTVFLVLRKRPVIFLHTFHHVTVALFCLHAALTGSESSHLFAAVNLFVHWLMYGYYGLSAIYKDHPLRILVRPWLTGLQLSQMVWGLMVGAFTIRDESTPHEHLANAYLCVAMYLSYSFLFADLFLRNYMPKMNSSRIIWLIALVVTTTCALGSLLVDFRGTRVASTALLALLGVYAHFARRTRFVAWWNPLLSEAFIDKDKRHAPEVLRLLCAPLATLFILRDVYDFCWLWGARSAVEAAAVTWITAREEQIQAALAEALSLKVKD